MADLMTNLGANWNHRKRGGTHGANKDSTLNVPSIPLSPSPSSLEKGDEGPWGKGKK